MSTRTTHSNLFPSKLDATKRGRFRLSYAHSEDLWGFLFIIPQLLGLIAFVLVPVAMSLYLCFARWDLTQAPVLTGLENIREVFQDDLFFQSMGNTFVIVGLLVPLTV